MVCFISKTTFYLKNFKWNECSPVFTALGRCCGAEHGDWVNSRLTTRKVL